MKGIAFRGLLLLTFGLAGACTPFGPNAPMPAPLPSPESTWTLQLTQSGGLLGVNLWVEVTSAGQLTARDERSGRGVTETVSAANMTKLQTLMAAAVLSQSAQKPSACADCFVYDLVFISATGTERVHADDVTLGSSSAADLVAFLRSLRDSALATQP